MREYAPYIIAFITQTVGFCVWIVKMNIDFNKKIGIMESKIETLEKDVERQEKDQKEISTKLAIVSELLAVCKNTLDIVSLKFMKTRNA